MREVFGEGFEGAEGFLNSATYGLPSRRQSEALHASLRQWELGEMAPDAFDASVGAARAAFARLAGVPADTVAMGGSVSTLLGLVAAAIPDDSRVVALEGEFTSVTGPFAAQERRGVTVTTLPTGEFEAAAGGYDIAIASLVQSADGRVLDVGRLRQAGAATSTRLVIDVTQAMGWMALDLSWADVVVGGSYKWLLAPRGAAWMSVRPPVADDLLPHAANWYASETPWSNTYTFPLLLAGDARRFDASPAWFTVLGAGISMPWLASLDMAAVQAQCVDLANRVRAGFGMPASNSAIVAIESAGAAERIEAAGIRAAVRSGRARVSFHLYNTDADVEALLDAR